jgi:hypothetical protein
MGVDGQQEVKQKPRWLEGLAGLSETWVSCSCRKAKSKT